MSWLRVQFAQRLAQMLREAGQPRARAEQFEFVLFFGEQGTQHHEPPLLVHHLRRRLSELVENEGRQPFKRQDVQPRVARQRGVRQQLALQLVSRLLRRQQDQRRAVRRGHQRRADFPHAMKRLPAARGAEKKTRLHATLLTAKETQSKARTARHNFPRCAAVPGRRKVERKDSA